MHKSFLDLLYNKNVEVEQKLEEENEVITGNIIIEDRKYPIINGVPVFFLDGSEENSFEQELTNKAFSFKWGETFAEYDKRCFGVSMDFVIKRLKPLGVHDVKEFSNFLKKKKMILEVGSGNGWMSSYMAQNTEGNVISAEIGDGVFSGYNLCRKLKNCHMIKADLMNLPFPDNSFDYIHADGVLHHTPDCKRAIKTLYKKLTRGGCFGRIFTEK